MRPIHFSAQAESDLRSIGAFTAKTWGLDQKKRYMDELKSRFAHIRKHPTIGSQRDEFGSGIRSVACGSHVIFNRDGTSAIEVLRVLHRRMDAGRHLDPFVS